MTEGRPPFPPFDEDSARQKVQAAEDAWNTRDPHRVSLAYTSDSVWRNRETFIVGREQIVAFLTAKWERELDYVLRKSTASPSAFSTSVTTGPGSGSAATAMSCGSSTTRA